MTTENQSKKSEAEKKPRHVYTKSAPTRGGARAGSGRPKGSTHKITAQELLEEFKQQAGKTLDQFIVEKILSANINNNEELVSKYILGLSKYVLQDIQQIDHTTNGQTIGNILFGTEPNPGFPEDTTDNE